MHIVPRQSSRRALEGRNHYQMTPNLMPTSGYRSGQHQRCTSLVWILATVVFFPPATNRNHICACLSIGSVSRSTRNHPFFANSTPRTMLSLRTSAEEVMRETGSASASLNDRVVSKVSSPEIRDVPSLSARGVCTQETTSGTAIQSMNQEG